MGPPIRAAVTALACVILGACHASRGRWTPPDTPYFEPEPVEAAAASIPESARTPSPWRPIGRSVQGRPLRVRTIGEGFRRVLWIGGIHGDEQEGVIATDQLARAFAATDLPASVTLMILEDINPDGRAADRRTNANGVDINRNFPAANFDSSNPKYGGRPLSQPESAALHALLLEWQPHLVIVSHAWRGRYFINYDGPARELAADFARISGYPLVPSSGFGATPGSLGSYVGYTLKWPILTLEYLRGKDPKQAWDETRDAILAVIAGA